MNKSIYSLGRVTHKYQKHYTCPHEGEREYNPYTQEWRCESCEHELAKFRYAARIYLEN